MGQFDRNVPGATDERLDRRDLLKVAAGGVLVGGFLAATPLVQGDGEVAAMVPNNFRGLVHVTNEDGLQYAYSALSVIAEHYKDAKGRLVIDGSAVKILTTDDGLNNIKAIHDQGSDIVAASDALQINGIDKDSLPDYIDTDNPGIIAVIDGLTKGFQYYKV